MRDFALIAEALSDADRRGEPAVLATVVRTEGSTYRRAGARMLLRRDGTTVGAVSGGCLEADLAARVDPLLAAGRPELVTYDTRSDEDLVWGLGLGCNGRVDVLLEPLTGDALARARAVHARCRDLSEPAVVTTVIAAGARAGARVGDRVMVTESGGPVALGLDLDAAPPELLVDACEALAAGSSTVRAYGAIEVVHEVVAPPLSLLVCGAGADAVPLVRLAVGLGWRVTVAEHRSGYARPDRFPGAAVRLPDGDASAADLGRGCDSAVVMSHHYERDVLYVQALLAAGVPYVGVLGPRRRTERMVAELGVSDADAARLYAPVGLDIGAETPDEIALAIVAEVQAVKAGRAAGPLRRRPGGIHDGACGSDPAPAAADVSPRCAP